MGHCPLACEGPETYFQQRPALAQRASSLSLTLPLSLICLISSRLLPRLLPRLLLLLLSGCHLNGSLYAEGSAVMSSAFCEYCYCIRGKKMCIRPRCHLSILGCLPRYSSEYACCPTSYSCGE